MFVKTESPRSLITTSSVLKEDSTSLLTVLVQVRINVSLTSLMSQRLPSMRNRLHLQLRLPLMKWRLLFLTYLAWLLSLLVSSRLGLKLASPICLLTLHLLMVPSRLEIMRLLSAHSIMSIILMNVHLRNEYWRGLGNAGYSPINGIPTEQVLATLVNNTPMLAKQPIQWLKLQHIG
jgi:hypothetical protein